MHESGKKEAEAASSQVTLTRHVDRGGCKKYGLFQNQQTDTKVLTQCLGGGRKANVLHAKKGVFEVRLCQSCTGSVVEVQVGKMQLVLASWVWYSTDGGSESESGDVLMRLMCLI